MIFPWLTILSQLRRTPITLLILALNVVFYFAFHSISLKMTSRIEGDLSSKEFIHVQAHYYREFIKGLSPAARGGDRGVLTDASIAPYLLAQASFRDADFVSSKIWEKQPYQDPVLNKIWLTTWNEFLRMEPGEPLGRFGLSIFKPRWSHYITYQFIHSNFMHLASNMSLFIVFGCLIELMFGSIPLVLIYLLTGIGGALIFRMTDGLGIAPLVGASGSVSGLMAFYIFAERRKNIPFFYFISPMEGFHGILYMSKYWLLPLVIVNDFAEMIAIPTWQQTVAHSVHLGAVLCGFLIAAVFHLFHIQQEWYLETEPEHLN